MKLLWWYTHHELFKLSSKLSSRKAVISYFQTSVINILYIMKVNNWTRGETVQSWKAKQGASNKKLKNKLPRADKKNIAFCIRKKKKKKEVYVKPSINVYKPKYFGTQIPVLCFPFLYMPNHVQNNTYIRYKLGASTRLVKLNVYQTFYCKGMLRNNRKRIK